MISPQEVVTKNNMAVAALQQGRQGESTSMMRTALSKLNDIYQEAGTEVEMEIDGNKVTSRPLGSVRVATPRSPDTNEPFPPFFRRALILSPEELNKPVIAAVVLYNVALSEHLIGFSLNNSRKIASAHMFYKLAYQIIDENKSKCIFEDLLVLAVINNLGDSCSLLYHTKKSKMWFRRLAQILGMTCGDATMAPALDEDDFMFFYLNAMMNQDMSNSASAA